MKPGLNMSVLKQDHFAYNEENVLETVIMGHKKLIQIKRKRIIYTLSQK